MIGWHLHVSYHGYATHGTFLTVFSLEENRAMAYRKVMSLGWSGLRN